MPHPNYAPIGPLQNYVQFKAFVRIVPLEGKRFETIRDMERIADRVEDAIRSFLSVPVDEPLISIATPVAFTPQFGDKTARLTITGYVQEAALLRADRTDATLDHDNQVMSGQLGGPNMARTVPVADVETAVKSLKALLEAASLDVVGHIYKMEYGGCVYGEGGRSFPL